MEAGRALFYGNSDDSNFNSTVFLQNMNQRLPYQSSKEPLLTPGFSPSFHGSSSMVSFCDAKGKGGLFRKFDEDENEYDDYFVQPEKKRRLTAEQVHFLEKSFDVENKLEPERKVELAKELGLQPRQIAIWFQNRRARWKNKQLERDYDGLKARYDDLKAKYDSLVKEKDCLKAEVHRFTDKLVVNKGKEKLRDDIQQPCEALALSKEHMGDDVKLNVKHEDTSPTKSDVLDSDVLELERSESDLSQEEEDDDSFNKNFMFSKVREDHYPNSSFYGFPVEDQAFGFWTY